MDHSEQIARIKNKLVSARIRDSSFRVFGASSHRYEMDPPVSESHVNAFEDKYDISLPECYRSFVTMIGSGGKAYLNSGAGPFYGIFPFGEEVGFFVESPVDCLNLPVAIFPGISETQWDDLTKPIEDDDISDEDYEETLNRIYGGVLPIGSQGCTYFHAILLNGEHKGKVVNIDMNFEVPKFTYENNFLDWYERWLDEVISGKLITTKPMWFGYAKKLS